MNEKSGKYKIYDNEIENVGMTVPEPTKEVLDTLSKVTIGRYVGLKEERLVLIYQKVKACSHLVAVLGCIVSKVRLLLRFAMK